MTFWDFVKKSGERWTWTGRPTHGGYGRATYRGHRDLAHRIAWRMAYGDIRDGLFVLHHCDNPACVRVDHLFLGTQQDNLRDMREKGRSRNPPHPVGEDHPRWRGGVASGLAGRAAFKAWHAAYERERRQKHRMAKMEKP